MWQKILSRFDLSSNYSNKIDQQIVQKLSFDKFDVIVIQLYGWYISKLYQDFDLTCYV